MVDKASTLLMFGATGDLARRMLIPSLYGLDSDGNPTGCPTAGNYYYYKAVWTVGNKTYTFIAPY